VNKPVTTLVFVIVGLATLAAEGPGLARLVDAVIPLVLVIGIVVAVLRLVWWYTR
jgi:hypothetical protein